MESDGALERCSAATPGGIWPSTFIQFLTCGLSGRNLMKSLVLGKTWLRGAQMCEPPEKWSVAPSEFRSQSSQTHWTHFWRSTFQNDVVMLWCSRFHVGPAASQSHSVGLNWLRKNRGNSPLSTWWHLGIRGRWYVLFCFSFWDQSMRDTWRFRHVSKATHVDSSATGGASRGHLYVSGYSFWTPCDMWLQEAKSISVTRVNFWATIYHQYREETPNSSSRPKRLLRGLPFLITSIFKSIEILERKAGCLTTLVHLDQRWRRYQKFLHGSNLGPKLQESLGSKFTFGGFPWYGFVHFVHQFMAM